MGKTAVAVELAAELPIEIISADSRQVYRGLDIGTAKPTEAQLRRVPHHGLDLIDPGTRYSAGRFARDAAGWIAEIKQRNRLPVVVGGTGLYVKALVEGLFHEPDLDAVRRGRIADWAARLADRDVVRIATRLDPGFGGGGRQRATRAIEMVLLTGRPLGHWQAAARQEGAVQPWYVLLSAPRPILEQRIRDRANDMVARGLVEEVAGVLEAGAAPRTAGLDGIGVREAVEFLTGERNRDSIAEAIALGTRRYAKRQMTWFRHQLTGGPVLHVDATDEPAAMARQIAEAWRKAQRDRE